MQTINKNSWLWSIFINNIYCFIKKQRLMRNSILIKTNCPFLSFDFIMRWILLDCSKCSHNKTIVEKFIVLQVHTAGHDNLHEKLAQSYTNVLLNRFSVRLRTFLKLCRKSRLTIFSRYNPISAGGWRQNLNRIETDITLFVLITTNLI